MIESEHGPPPLDLVADKLVAEQHNGVQATEDASAPARSTSQPKIATSPLGGSTTDSVIVGVVFQHVDRASARCKLAWLRIADFVAMSLEHVDADPEAAELRPIRPSHADGGFIVQEPR